MLRRITVLAAASALAAIWLVSPPAQAGTTTVAKAAAPTAAASTMGTPTDPNIKFVGRWNTSSPTGYIPNWTGAYWETEFTGTTLKLLQRNSVNLYVSLDRGPYVFYQAVRGTVNVTPKPLKAGTHRVQVSYRSGDDIFQGLTLDAGAHTVNPALPAKLIEFVGDSITFGGGSTMRSVGAYGYLVGEQLKVQHTQIARSGYCLSAYGACASKALVNQFVMNDSVGTTPWDFTKYQASAVVINLGTNDAGAGVPAARFQSDYVALLRTVRAKYPKAAIIALETFKLRYPAETEAAVNTLRAAGDSNVHYVKTEGWLIVPTDYVDTNGHPNDGGNLKVANRLAPILKPLIGL